MDSPKIEKKRYPAADARRVADSIVAWMHPLCDRIAIAGSLRRERETVGDVEIVFIGHAENRADPGDLLGNPIKTDLAAAAVDERVRRGEFARRLNRNGSPMWGMVNRFAVHTESGIPVDFFETTEECWFNYLVCRTGGEMTNIQIAKAARQRGFGWNPYGTGFHKITDMTQQYPMGSEEDVFRFVGLEYVEPALRL